MYRGDDEPSSYEKRIQFDPSIYIENNEPLTVYSTSQIARLEKGNSRNIKCEFVHVYNITLNCVTLHLRLAYMMRSDL